MGEPEPTHWIERHADALFGYALIQLGNREEAEERVQETFLAALEARATFRGESSERTWLMGILKHKICDHFRRRGRKASTQEPAAASAAVAAMFTEGGKRRKGPRRWPGEPGAILEQGEFWLAVRDCLSKLPARMGEAFCLRQGTGWKRRKPAGSWRPRRPTSGRSSTGRGPCCERASSTAGSVGRLRGTGNGVRRGHGQAADAALPGGHGPAVGRLRR